MNGKISNTVKKFTKAMNSKKSKPTGYTTTAEVVRVDSDGKAWVHMDGGYYETPAIMGVDCKKGDKVRIQVNNKSATVTGNLTAPPTDDTAAKKVDADVNRTRRDLQDNIKDVEVTVDQLKETVEHGKITKIETQYCLHTSNSNPPGDSSTWLSSPPQYIAGRYYWKRTKVTYADETIAYGTPILDGLAQLSEEANYLLNSVNNHFWNNETGAYVSENNKTATTGYATRIASSGIAQMYNGVVLNTFTGSGITYYAYDANATDHRVMLVTYASSGIQFNDDIDFVIGSTSGNYIKWDSAQDKIIIHADSIEMGGRPVATDEYMEFSSTNGLRVYSGSKDSSTYNTSYTQIQNTGIDIVSGGVNRARFAETTRIGSETDFNIQIKPQVLGAGVFYAVGQTIYGSSSLSIQRPMGTDIPYLIHGVGTNGVLQIKTPTNEFQLADKDNHALFTRYNTSTDNYAAGFCVTTLGKNTKVSLHIGSGGTNHGVYSNAPHDKWIIYANSSGDALIPMAASSSTKALYITSAGKLQTTSSSRSVKKDIEDINNVVLDPTKLYDLRVAQFRYKDPELWGEGLFPGFIAEEMLEVYPAAACVDKNGNAVDWDVRNIVPPMLKLLQDQQKQIDELQMLIN